MIQCKMVLPEQHTLALRVRVGHDLKTEHTACPDRMVSKRQTLSRWKHGMSRCEPVGSVFDTVVQVSAMLSAFTGSGYARMISRAS